MTHPKRSTCGRECHGCDYTCPDITADCPYGCSCDYCPCEDDWFECDNCRDREGIGRFCSECSKEGRCPRCGWTSDCEPCDGGCDNDGNIECLGDRLVTCPSCEGRGFYEVSAEFE